ncbi:MAG: hypothetical protein ACRDWI_11935 [Jiangellaceae bacterium]
MDTERHEAVVLVAEPSDDALRELTGLDLALHARGSVLRWDAVARAWLTHPR